MLAVTSTITTASHIITISWKQIVTELPSEPNSFSWYSFFLRNQSCIRNFIGNIISVSRELGDPSELCSPKSSTHKAGLAQVLRFCRPGFETWLYFIPALKPF